MSNFFSNLFFKFVKFFTVQDKQNRSFHDHCISIIFIQLKKHCCDLRFDRLFSFLIVKYMLLKIILYIESRASFYKMTRPESSTYIYRQSPIFSLVTKKLCLSRQVHNSSYSSILQAFQNPSRQILTSYLATNLKANIAKSQIFWIGHASNYLPILDGVQTLLQALRVAVKNK